MSQKNVEIVRHPLTVSPSSRRRLEERAGLRFPGIRALLLQSAWRLPLRSRLRQALLRRVVQSGLEAVNRADFEVAFAVYDSEVELISDPRLTALGFERVYRGREERIRFQERWTAERGDFQFAPGELVDLGDGRLFASGRIVGSGLSSGAGFDGDWACLWTISAGRVIREQFFFDRSDALEAAGLRE